MGAQRPKNVGMGIELEEAQTEVGMIVERADAGDASRPAEAIPEGERFLSWATDQSSRSEGDQGQAPGNGAVEDVVNVGPDFDAAEGRGGPVGPVDGLLGISAETGNIGMSDEVMCSTTLGGFKGPLRREAGERLRIGQAESEKMGAVRRADLRAAEAKGPSVPADQSGAADVGGAMVAQDDEVESDVDGDVDDGLRGRATVAEGGVHVDGAGIFAFSHRTTPRLSSGARPQRRRHPGGWH